MTLTKYKIGELITVVDERNSLGLKKFYGININKEFMPTAADTNGLDATKYKIVRKERTDSFLVVCRLVEMNVFV